MGCVFTLNGQGASQCRAACWARVGSESVGSESVGSESAHSVPFESDPHDSAPSPTGPFSGRPRSTAGFNRTKPDPFLSGSSGAHTLTGHIHPQLPIL